MTTTRRRTTHRRRPTADRRPGTGDDGRWVVIYRVGRAGALQVAETAEKRRMAAKLIREGLWETTGMHVRLRGAWTAEEALSALEAPAEI